MILRSTLFVMTLVLFGCSASGPRNYAEFVSVFGPDQQKVAMPSGNYQVVVLEQRDTVMDETPVGMSDGARSGVRPEYPLDLGKSVILFCDTIYVFKNSDVLSSKSVNEKSCNLNEF